MKCDDVDAEFKAEPHGDFFILKNFIKSRISFKCYESITYATHAEANFLKNLIPVVTRWKAPVSLAIYAPGSDFNTTLKAIYYLRNCVDEKEFIQDFVTFHIFFEKEFYNENLSKSYKEAEKMLECNESFLYNISAKSYRNENNFTYPVNVARNLAKNSSMTHLVFVSDIELYPSLNVVKSFLKMLNENYGQFDLNRDVFPLPIFEIEANVDLPNTKDEIVKLFNAKKAFWFHFRLCPACHMIPYSDEWLKDNSTEFKIASRNKRSGKFHNWEPLYIGTKNNPWYDERLNWEGKGDKMTQSYIMCVLDFNFNVLSNAFLVHRPGIKTLKEVIRKNPLHEIRQNEMLKNIIYPGIIREYGNNENCKN